MRKISNLLSLYLYEFSSCMNKTAQIADNFLNEVWWDLNLSQLVVSDIFCFSTSISIWRVFSSSSIQYFIWYFSSRFACLFVWTQVQHRNWRPTSVSDQVWFGRFRNNWVQDLLSHGSYMFDTMRIQTSKIQRVSFFPFKKTRVDRDFCVQRKT